MKIKNLKEVISESMAEFFIIVGSVLISTTALQQEKEGKIWMLLLACMMIITGVMIRLEIKN